jgi:hypothetical protein
MLMMTLYWFAIGVLGVWRITHLLNAEDGPGAVMAHVRRIAGSGLWGDLLDCFYCLSLWVAMPFALVLAREWGERLLVWLALSGAASLLERAPVPPAPRYTEEPLQQQHHTGDRP